MTWPFSLFDNANSASRNTSARINKEQIAAFRSLLEQQAAIRLLVGTGGSFGNQSATVNLLRRLTDPLTAAGLTYAYAGKAEVYYQGGEDTLAKLYELLPELEHQPSGKLNQATVELKAYPQAPPADKALFGFTGAVDDSAGNYATGVNVEYFLQLQPYNYNYAEKIDFVGARRPAIDLLQVPELNNPSFRRRVSYVPESSYAAPDWADYADNPRAAILRYLTGDALLKQVRLVVSYAIMPSAQNVVNSSPEAAAAVLCGGLLDYQDNGDDRLAAPVVVLNLNRFGSMESEAPLQAVAGLLRGDMTRDEVVVLTGTDPKNASRRQAARQVHEARRRYMASLNAVQRFSWLNYPTSTAAVEAAVNAIVGKPNQVLFIQLGPVPQPLFYYALFKTNTLSLFEGANSMMAAINMGRPFLALPRKGLGVQPALYPSVNRGLFSASPPINELAAAANQLNFSLDSWPTGNQSGNPCRQLGAFIQSLCAQTATDDPIPRYFRELKAFYATSSADKLNVAVAYLMNVFQAEHALQAAAARRARRADGEEGGDEPAENPLNALYLELKEKLGEDGEIQPPKRLDLVPGILAGGNINEAVLALLQGFSASLWLEVSQFKHEGEEDDIASIRLEGMTGIFASLQISNRIAVIFDAPEQQLRMNLELSAEGTWSLPGVPWIQMSGPFLRLSSSDGQISVTAALGGRYQPLGAELQLLAPSAGEQALLTVKFDAPYPGIDRAFQMAAAVNLVAVLPPPLNVLADLGLSQLDLYYLSKEEDASALGFIIRSNSAKPVPLVGKVALSNVEAQVALIDPVKTRQVRASANGNFIIGSGEQAGVVAVGVQYPDWQFRGTLESGVIRMEDLLSLFLPGVDLTLPSLPVIDSFVFNYAQAADNLQVSLNLVFQPAWTFEFFGKPLFKLDNVGFSVSRAKLENQGNITANTTLLPDMAHPLVVGIGASYAGGGDWAFSIQQQDDTVFSINELLEQYLGRDWRTVLSFPDVSKLTLQLDWGKQKATSFEFSAATASAWVPIPALPDVSVTGRLKLGYLGKKAAERLGLAPLSTEGDDPPQVPGTYGEIGADLTLWNIKLGVSYNFAPGKQELSLRWLTLLATVTTDKQGDTVATFKLDNKSIGEMVETFVSWATGAEFGLAAPWNVLNSFSLSGLELVYNFSKKQVGFNIGIGPVDFGFFTLKGVALKYDPQVKDAKVEITVQGSFVWQSGDALSWDPSKPETTPAPPGGGNKYLDLRLLALGQHVTVPGLVEETSVQGVIAKLRSLEVPNPPEVPVGGKGQPVFAPDNSWFIAFDFGVLKTQKDKEAPAAKGSQQLITAREAAAADEEADEYLLQLSMVFNDPTLYALRVALAGPMAKIFAGLDFQILYRQVSETVGCYSANIALPNLMRKFQIGVATITLPEFGINLYTNGDFQVDIGFPWRQDFARSFTIELIVAPGIPVLGSAGFYFGKLSSATTNLVPVSERGWFNPVLVFGFGAQLGLGKSIELGILRAGFSLTVFGVIEGVLARWLPYREATPSQGRDQLQDGYYFSLIGTAGVQGRLYGSIDFAIIRADVNIAIKIYVRLSYIAYQDIPISANASVEVSVDVKINLGLFTITIGLSFSASVQATFVLKNPAGNNPPWGRTLPGNGMRTLALAGGLPARHAAAELEARRLRRALGQSGGAGPRLAANAAGYQPAWGNLQAGQLLQLTGWTVPVLTVAGDQAKTAAEQLPCYVAAFFLATPEPVKAGGALAAARNGGSEQGRLAHAALARARRRPALNARLAANGGEDGFEDLAVRVLQWVLAAGMSSAMSPDQLNQQVVSADFLNQALQYFSNPDQPLPIPADQVEAFLARQATICFASTAAANAHGVFFPAPPGVRLNVPSYAGAPGYDYVFGQYNSSQTDYLLLLRQYFQQLQVQVEGGGAPTAGAVRMQSGTGASIASYIFGDYFCLLARQALQALRDGLGNFKLVIQPAQTVAEIVDWVNATGQLSGDDAFSAGQLFVANQEHPLAAGARPLTVEGMRWQTPGGLSFEQVAAQSLFGGGFNGEQLARANADEARILAANQRIVLGDKVYLTQDGDSLTGIAAGLGVSLDALLQGSDVLRRADLLSSLAILALPAFSQPVAVGDTLAGISARLGVSLDLLAGANGAAAGLFDHDSDPNLNIPELAQFQVGELIDEALRTLAFQNLGAMASRYYLNGLRLPTAGLTAKSPGLFVKPNGQGGYDYPAQLGLFALTGQAFPLPALQDPAQGAKFSFTLSRGAAETWLSLGAPGSASASFEVSQDDYLRYVKVRATATGQPLRTDTRAIRPLLDAEAQASRFPLSSSQPWQCAAPVALPRQARAPEVAEPRLWSLPDSLINTPLEQGVLPRFAPQLARTDAATGSVSEQPLLNYGFGMLIPFGVRRTQPLANNPSSHRLYEIIGAPDKEIVLLERVLSQLQGPGAGLSQLLVLYRPAATGSEVAGWQMENPAASLAGIAKVNLSTETRPPAQNGLRALALTENAFPNLIGAPDDFLRLLWEASITRQGGFFLSYSQGLQAGGTLSGLPDHVFNDSGEADLAVLALFAADEGEGQAVGNWMNVLATNESFDASAAALVATAVLRREQTAPLADAATLDGVAAGYYSRVDSLARLNAGRPLRDGAVLRVHGGVYQVAPTGAAPGGDLARIAEHFFTTEEAIKQANPYRASWSGPLVSYTALRLPEVDVTVGRRYANGAVFSTLDDVSAYFQAPLAGLAAANARTPGLFPAQTALEVELGPFDVSATTQAGVAGIELERKAAPPVPDRADGADWGWIYLANLFNLLGYRNSLTDDFKESNFGVATGPGNIDGNGPADKVRAPRAANEDEPWRYVRTVPYPGLYRHPPVQRQASPAVSGSPYLGVGGLLQIELAWLDLFGNRILSDLDAPPAEARVYNFPPQLTGYTDSVLGIGQWPSVANDYLFATLQDGKAGLKVSLAFDQQPYLDAAKALDAGGRQRIEQAIAIYAKVLYQLQDPNGLGIELSSSVCPEAALLEPSQQAALVNWAVDIYAWLNSLLPNSSGSHQERAAGFQPLLELSAPLQAGQINDDQIFRLDASLTLSRKPQLVSGALAAVSGVADAGTLLSPSTGPLQGDQTAASAQRDLKQFAARFEQALSTPQGPRYQVATGSDRNAFTGGSGMTLWAVQLGRDAAQGISYRLLNPGQPKQFAPRPVSNQLASKLDAAIIPYRTGKVISLQDPAEPRAFTDVDLDQWLQSSLARIDQLLSPAYVAPAQILRSLTGNNAMQGLLDAKEALAQALKSAMIPVFRDESADQRELDAIREAFFQRMLGTLSEFYAVRAGLQFQAEVNAAIQPSGTELTPRLYGNIVSQPGGSGIMGRGNLSLTAPKLGLKLAGDGGGNTRLLSFLLSSAGLEAKKVDLDLVFEGQNIEHQIGALAGIRGYQPSSWLSFVADTAGESWPLRQALGAFSTPIVLRAFPETPTLTLQEAAANADIACPCRLLADEVMAARLTAAGDPACSRPGDYNPLAALSRWNYRLRYALQRHFEQDAINGQIDFNLGGQSGLRAMALSRDLFDNLAEMTQVFPKVVEDLNRFLLPLDINSKDPAQIQNAEAALLSAGEMVQWLADSAGGGGLLQANSRLLAQAEPIRFVIEEDAVERVNPDGGKVSALRVTLTLAQALPERAGQPFVQVEPERYECEPEEGEGLSRSFTYLDRSTGAYLAASEGKGIAARMVVLPDLDILERQDANAQVFLRRNEELVPGRPTAEPFVYQTPTVSLSAPLRPTVDSDQPVNMAVIYAQGADQPVSRSLECQLGLFYQALFGHAGSDSAILSLTVYYEYRLNDALSKVRLPVYLMPPTEVALQEGGGGLPLADVVVQQARGCVDWFAAHEPEQKGGSLWFDLTVSSNLTEQAQPLLRLRNVFLELTRIEPPMV